MLREESIWTRDTEQGERIEICLPMRIVAELEELAGSHNTSVEQLTAQLVLGALGLLLERQLKREGRWQAVYQRQWRRRNPEKVKANAARWRANHPGYSTRYWRAHRAAILQHRKLRRLRGETDRRGRSLLAKNGAISGIREARP